MIKLDQIVDKNDVRLDSLVELYENAFPEIERRESKQLKELIEKQKDMKFYAIHFEDELAGLFIVWDLGGFHYIEHFAIFEHLRNKKLGEKLLSHFKEMTFLPVLLEAEPAEEEMAARRIGFYERNGFEIVEKEYRQLPYRKGGKSFQLWIMSNQSYANPTLLQEHIYTIKERVYSRFW